MVISLGHYTTVCCHYFRLWGQQSLSEESFTHMKQSFIVSMTINKMTDLIIDLLFSIGLNNEVKQLLISYA